MGELLDVVRDGAVATIRMHRGPVNAIAPDLLVALGEAVHELGADDAVRCVVLASDIPGYFMAGADLTVLAGGGMTEGADSLEDAWRALTAHFTAVERLAKPVVAAVSGHALGGGCEMALCCDYRVMLDDDRATIGLTETRLGILPGAGGTQRLPRLIGLAAARPMIFEGTRLKAGAAAAIGLVDVAAPPGEFDTAVSELAERLARLATRAVGLAKIAMLDGLDGTLEDGLRGEARAFAQVLSTEDAAEGISAFLGKRPAEFRGR